MADNFQPAVVRYSKGSFIIVEGKPSADRFYIIQEGKVQITRETDSIKGGANMAGPGEIFGVVSAMASRNYIESAVALTDVTLMAVERGHIIKSTSIAVNIITQFSQRLRELNETYSRRVMNSVSSNDPSHILQIGKYFEKVRKFNQAMYAYQQYLVYCPDAGNIADVKRKIDAMKSRVTVTRPVYSPNTMVQKYPKDCLLFAEGESGDNLFIIQNGSIKIAKIVDNQEVILAVLGKGDILGEMAMLEDKPRIATAEVYEDTTLLSVSQSNFESLINEQPDMVIRLTSLMAERIWLRYRQLTNTLISNSLGRLYDTLLIQFEKDRIDLNSTNPYLCNFGFNELIAMAGIPEIKTNELFSKVSAARRIIVQNNKVLVTNVAGISKETEYYRRARQMGKDIKDI